jgi:hypothetical protein
MRGPETHVPIGQDAGNESCDRREGDIGELRQAPALAEIMRSPGGNKGGCPSQIDVIAGLISVAHDQGDIELSVDKEQDGNQRRYGKARQGLRQVRDKAAQAAGKTHEGSVACNYECDRATIALQGLCTGIAIERPLPAPLGDLGDLIEALGAELFQARQIDVGEARRQIGRECLRAYAS